MAESNAQGSADRLTRYQLALEGLTGEAARIWHEREDRRRALAEAVDAARRGDAVLLDRATHRVDSAIVAGLRACGLPRGPITIVRFERFDRNWRGRKSPSCELLIDSEWAAISIDVGGQPDDVFRTWLHESLHARQPFVSGYRRDWEEAAGYEEGLVEGLARLILRAQPGMAVVEGSFGGYIAAYTTLASILGQPVDDLWHHLWHYPCGAVRAAFPDVVIAACAEARAGWRPERRRILAQAEALFRTSQARRGIIDVDRLRADWERALR